MSKLNIVIIDYQLSNLFSVQHACEYAGIDAKITSNPKEVSTADALILPGVGAFGDAMKNLQQLNLIQPILNHINNKKPFMGICLGLQLLFDSSEEFGNHQGLGVVKGKVVKFPSQNSSKKILKVPHMGWNKIMIQKNCRYLENINNGEFMYFVHSYYVLPEEEDIILTKTIYTGFEYTSAIFQNNIFAVQFHPEKSGPEGLKIYQNFAKILKAI